MARRMLKLQWVGMAGRSRLIVGKEEEQARLWRELGLFGEAVRQMVDVDVSLSERLEV